MLISSLEKIKKCTHKNLLLKTQTVFRSVTFSEILSRFSKQVRIQHKVLRCLDIHYLFSKFVKNTFWSYHAFKTLKPIRKKPLKIKKKLI